MGWKSTVRTIQAAQRRQQREALKRQRELEQEVKQQEKLSTIERAQLEVKAYENHITGLLSIHKEQSEAIDWKELATSLPPPPPEKKSFYELRARQQIMVLRPDQRSGTQAQIEEAQSRDEQIFKDEAKTYWEQKADWERLKELSRRVLAGEHRSYTDAILAFNPFAEMSQVGSSINFIVHTTKLVECVLKIKGRQAIPAEVKTLTTTGKVSMRQMPKGRFHEIYQDYLSGCVLRVGREMLALLPIDIVLLTALADFAGDSASHAAERTVLSVVMPRRIAANLNFNELDSTDAIERFQHRGDFKASRKTENFSAIEPLTPADIANRSVDDASLEELIAAAQKSRNEMEARLAKIAQPQTEFISEATFPI